MTNSHDLIFFSTYCFTVF